MTMTRPGPWTPTVSVSSMSAVRLGPVTNVHSSRRDDDRGTAIGEMHYLGAVAQIVQPNDRRQVRRRQQRRGARTADARQQHHAAGVGQRGVAAGHADVGRSLLLARTVTADRVGDHARDVGTAATPDPS